MNKQYTAFPLHPETRRPSVAPELGVHFSISGETEAECRAAGVIHADTIATAMHWLDRGVREVYPELPDGLVEMVMSVDAEERKAITVRVPAGSTYAETVVSAIAEATRLGYRDARTL
jgi:hypothetical protein